LFKASSSWPRIAELEPWRWAITNRLVIQELSQIWAASRGIRKSADADGAIVGPEVFFGISSLRHRNHYHRFSAWFSTRIIGLSGLVRTIVIVSAHVRHRCTLFIGFRTSISRMFLGSARCRAYHYHRLARRQVIFTRLEWDSALSLSRTTGYKPARISSP